jgi:hypothetical protein
VAEWRSKCSRQCLVVVALCAQEGGSGAPRVGHVKPLEEADHVLRLHLGKAAGRQAVGRSYHPRHVKSRVWGVSGRVDIVSWHSARVRVA